jgi:predicted ATPase
MPSYILTGPPGAGKTAVLRQLEIIGYAVVEEAATESARPAWFQFCGARPGRLPNRRR